MTDSVESPASIQKKIRDDISTLYGLQRRARTPFSLPIVPFSPSSTSGAPTGGQSDPEIRPWVEHGVIGLVTESIDLSIAGGNFHRIILSDDIGIAFNNPPTFGLVERFIIQFEQDGLGGHDVTTWPASLANVPTIDQAIGARTRVEFYTFDGGIVYHALTVTSGGPGGGISFPVRHNITNRGTSWTSPQTINLLGDADKHTWKWTVNKNLDLTTINNIPTANIQHTFELEMIHDNSASTFTVTLPNNFYDENGNALISFQISGGKTALLSVRINDGVNFLVVQKNILGVSSGSQTPWLSDIDAATFDLSRLDRLLFDKALGSTLTATDTGVTSNASGGLDYNLGGLSGQYNFIMNADGVIRLQINNTSVISQSLFPVDATPVSGDTLGSLGNEWARIHATDYVLKSGANSSKLIFDGNAATPKTYFTGSDTLGTVHFFSQILGVPVNVMSFTNSNVGLFGNTDLILDTGQIRAGGAGKGMENIGELAFISNLATPAGNGIFYFDGTDMKVKTGSGIKNLSDIVAGGQAHTIQDEGSSLTQRTNLDFIGSGVTVTDDAPGNKTKVTISASTVSDGDKGDISVTSSGSVWTIDNAAVTGTKIASTAITNTHISSSAAIQKSKISTSGTWAIGDIPTNFARQDVVGTFTAQKTFSQQTIFNALINMNDNEVDNVKQVGIRENFATGFSPSGQTNEAILFSVPTAGGKTELRCKFQGAGGSIVIATEP